jgi:hypothetical protein
MRFQVAVILLGTMLAAAARQKQQPDVAIINGNAFESPFFKFHYAFPQGWSAEDDQARMNRNRVEHENAVGRTKADPPLQNYYGPAPEVFWRYDLLVASAPRSAAEKSAQPYVRLCALQRFNGLGSPGKYAKLMLQVNTVKMFHEGQKQTIAGRAFVRTDVISKDGQFVAMFETLTRDYLLLFEFHGRNEQEINELAKSMESLKFDAK